MPDGLAHRTLVDSFEGREGSVVEAPPGWNVARDQEAASSRGQAATPASGSGASGPAGVGGAGGGLLRQPAHWRWLSAMGEALGLAHGRSPSSSRTAPLLFASVRFEVLLAAVASAALALKLWLAWSTYGTNDVYAYQQFATWARYLGSGLYAAAWDFNHPPSMLPVLQALDWVARATGVSFAFWLRSLPTLADACAVALVYRLFAGELRKPGVRAGLIVLAGSPALVLVSGFHGNTDSIIMCLLLLSVCWTERAGRDVLSGAALGLALCIKIVPLVVVPALLLYRVEWGRRLRFVLGAAGVVGVAWVPWMLPDASRALAQVFGYRGQYGHWGVSWLAAHLLPGAAGLNAVLRSAGFPLLAAGVLALSVRMNRRSERPAAYAQLGVVFAALLAFGSAFGVQYLAWLSPWLVGLPVAAVLLHALAAGAFLLVVYNYWSGALPWFLADSNQVGDYAGHADYQQVLCWVSVVIVFGAALMQVEARSLRWPSVRLAPAKWWQFGALAAAVALAWPSVVLFRRDATRGPKVSEQALVPILAQQDVKLSSVLMRTGRNQEGVEVARRATETDPGQALAWNNLAAGYAGLALWDEAIVAAERAVRLSPRFQLAHTNLAWARQQKAQEQARAAHR